ncbi:MAG TPA: glycosyltransferase family 2 protein [Anaerolineales bacterium]|nr:glycosyltransferase family 2 protein [Anaerolineales bacterium]
MSDSITCVAIIAVRNEAEHIHRALAAFTAAGVDVVVIDNDSTDDSVDRCREFDSKGLLFMDRLPWRGYFDLSAQLKAKQKIAQKLSHDWVIHADADEWLQSPASGETLLQGIKRVSQQGYNIINFDEFVFLPVKGDKLRGNRYEKDFLHYYYFAPARHRLMRAWRNSVEFTNVASGGHRVHGGHVKLCPENFVLRHYIALSYEHAVRKYVGRAFSQVDLSKNWHGNRRDLTTEQLRFPTTDRLKKLGTWDSVDFDRSEPFTRHYWEWS